LGWLRYNLVPSNEQPRIEIALRKVAIKNASILPVSWLMNWAWPPSF
jgi:hypothetical protein